MRFPIILCVTDGNVFVINENFSPVIIVRINNPVTDCNPCDQNKIEQSYSTVETMLVTAEAEIFASGWNRSQYN